MKLSQWYIKEIPVHNGKYDVLFYDGSIRMIEWIGKWKGMPSIYIKAWRGVVRG